MGKKKKFDITLLLSWYFYKTRKSPIVLNSFAFPIHDHHHPLAAAAFCASRVEEFNSIPPLLLPEFTRTRTEISTHENS